MITTVNDVFAAEGVWIFLLIQRLSAGRFTLRGLDSYAMTVIRRYMVLGDNGNRNASGVHPFLYRQVGGEAFYR